MIGVRLETCVSESRLTSSGIADLHTEGNGTPLQDSCLENPMDGGLQSVGSLRVGHD